jgi:glycosyltransferase involved in cell wall biosynthesis
MENVTVLVTLKNNIQTIKRCIDSILNLNYSSFDVVVVDAFSTDGSYEILKKYKKKIKLYQYKGNAASGFNFGLSKVKTKYVALTDADCVVDINWLTELMKPFQTEELAGTAGYCGTPRDVNLLSKAVGLELESRFREAGDYVSRAPTMNLCFRTDYGKKIKFDEKLKVAFETDFGFRLSKLGKIKFVKDAKVYHYHRSSWTTFFKQQKDYAKYAMNVYSKHREKMKGDYISTFDMIVQPPIALLSILFITLGLINGLFLCIGAIFLLVLLFIYMYRLTKIRTSPKLWPMLTVMFFVRTVAWIIGIFESLTNRF